MCRDTLAGLPQLKFLPVPPSRCPGQFKYAGTFLPGTQHAGTAFGGTQYSKICRYVFAGNAIYMPEIDANEVKQLLILILIASLTGRTVGFGRLSEGDGCTRTRHRHLSHRGPFTTFSTGVPIRTARCSAGPHTLGGAGGLHGCRPPNKKWFCRKGTRPEPKNKIKQMDLTAPKKKTFYRMKKKHSKENKKNCLEGNEPRTYILQSYISSPRPLGQ